MPDNLTYRYTKDFDSIVKFLNRNFSSPTHYPEWNLVISKFFNTDLFYLICEDRKEIIGICPVHKKKNVLSSELFSGPRHRYMPYGGWICKNGTKIDISEIPIKFNEAFIGFSLPLISEYKVLYDAPKISKLETLLIDLSKSEDEIWKSDIDSKRRNMIRKANNNNISIETINPLNSKEFYEVLSITNKQYNIETLQKEFYHELFSSAKEIKFDLFWAKYKGDVLGGLLMVSDKDFSIYWLGMSIDGAPNLGQGELLQWEAIKKAKSYGCKYYDLCTIEKERLPHIYEFKKGFSKREINFLSFSYRTFFFRLAKRINNGF